MFSEAAPRGGQPDDHLLACATQDGASQEHRRTQCPRLQVGFARSTGLLIQTEQIEGEQNSQKRGLRGPEGLQTEPLDRQFRFEFFNALLDTRPPAVGAPHLHGLIRPVGHPQAEGVAGAPRSICARPPLFPGSARAPPAQGFGPALDFTSQLGHGVVLVHRRPPDPDALAPKIISHLGHNDVGQALFLQKAHQRPPKNRCPPARTGASPLRATTPRPPAKKAKLHWRRWCSHCATSHVEQREPRPARLAADDGFGCPAYRVVTPLAAPSCRPERCKPLSPHPDEILPQTRPVFRATISRADARRPARAPARNAGRSCEWCHRRGIAPFPAWHEARVIRPQPLRMGKAPCSRHHGRHKGRERVRQGDGVVGGRSRERQGRLQLLDISDLSQERNEAGQTTKRGDGLGGFLQKELGSAKREN